MSVGLVDEGIAARVELVEHLGDVSILHARLDGMARAMALKLDKKVAQYEPGERIGVKLASSSVTLFDAKGEAVAFERSEVGEHVRAVVRQA